MEDRTGKGFPGIGVVTATAALLLLSSPLHSAAQDPVGGAGDFTANIRRVESGTQTVSVSMGKSILLDLSKPIVRAAIAADEVAGVVVLSPTQVMVTGKGFGTTQLVVWTADDERKIFDIIVQVEIPQLKALIQRAAPGSNVYVEVIQSSVVLLGDVPSAQTAERIAQLAGVFSGNVINHLRVRGEQQVLLRCTVAEVSKQALRSLGINGFLAGKQFQDAFLLNNIGGLNPSSISMLEDVPSTASIPFLTNENGLSASTTFSLGFPRLQMQLFVRALRENGLAHVLAEPNLVALSGQTATFLAGGEFPVPVPQDQNTITIEYREFGIRLNFTPTVLGHDMIRLRVAPEVSELDFSSAVQFAGFNVPGLTERSAETTVELASGQTLAMAGLLSEQVRANVAKIPGIGDLPILGQLFSSIEYESVTTELVILVTPEVIAGLNPKQVPPVPGERHVAPNDWELFFLGQIEGEPQPPSDSPATRALETEFPTRVSPESPASNLAFRGPWGPSSASETQLQSTQ